MLRRIASKVTWMARATTTVVGLAIMLALVFGLATTALGANGQAWILGKNNVVTAITKLAGAAGVNGPMLQLTNNNADANDTALDLRVQAGEAPMRVNSGTKVANLNADKLDGIDSAGFLSLERIYEVYETRDSGPNTIWSGTVSCDDEDVAISGGYSHLAPTTHVRHSLREPVGPRYTDELHGGGPVLRLRGVRGLTALASVGSEGCS